MVKKLNLNFFLKLNCAEYIFSEFLGGLVNLFAELNFFVLIITIIFGPDKGFLNHFIIRNRNIRNIIFKRLKKYIIGYYSVYFKTKY